MDILCLNMPGFRRFFHQLISISIAVRTPIICATFTIQPIHSIFKLLIPLISTNTHVCDDAESHNHGGTKQHEDVIALLLVERVFRRWSSIIYSFSIGKDMNVWLPLRHALCPYHHIGRQCATCNLCVQSIFCVRPFLHTIDPYIILLGLRIWRSVRHVFRIFCLRCIIHKLEINKM